MSVHDLFGTIETFGNTNTNSNRANTKMYDNKMNIESRDSTAGAKVQANQYQANQYQPNQYQPNGNRAMNQLTSNKYDTCEYENQLRIGSKPMKYFVNQLNTPQMNPFTEFTVIGNQQVYNVQNSFEHALPTRLNPVYQTYVFPYNTTPNLAQAAPSMMYSDTDSNLRFGTDLRQKKSAVVLSEIDYNRWEPGVNAETVQNSGQFNVGGKFQANSQGIDRDGFFDYKGQNNVLFANSAWPNGGISSRNQLHNFQDINQC